MKKRKNKRETKADASEFWIVILKGLLAEEDLKRGTEKERVPSWKPSQAELTFQYAVYP